MRKEKVRFEARKDLS